MAVKSLVCFSYPGIRHGGEQGLSSESDTILERHITDEADKDAIERQPLGHTLRDAFERMTGRGLVNKARGKTTT